MYIYKRLYGVIIHIVLILILGFLIFKQFMTNFKVPSLCSKAKFQNFLIGTCCFPG